MEEKKDEMSIDYMYWSLFISQSIYTLGIVMAIAIMI